MVLAHAPFDQRKAIYQTQQNTPQAYARESIGGMGKNIAASLAGQAPTINVQNDRQARASELIGLLNTEEDRGIAAEDRQRKIAKELYTETQSALGKYLNSEQLDNDVDVDLKAKGIDPLS